MNSRDHLICRLVDEPAPIVQALAIEGLSWARSDKLVLRHLTSWFKAAAAEEIARRQPLQRRENVARPSIRLGPCCITHLVAKNNPKLSLSRTDHPSSHSDALSLHRRISPALDPLASTFMWPKTPTIQTLSTVLQSAVPIVL